MDVQENLNIFMFGKGKSKGRYQIERYSSYDYCFNYFRSFFESNKLYELCSPKNIQMSCLQLGFYLASWGMYRGSSFLLQKSIKIYEPLIKLISEMDVRFWKIDVDNYSESNLQLLIDCYKKIEISLEEEERSVTQTLITKIMLVVFGSVPAFDEFFRKGMKVYNFNKNSLQKIREFHIKHKNDLEEAIINFNLKIKNKRDRKIYTFNFITGKESRYYYTKAKLIDMVCWVEGKEMKNKK